MLINVPLCALVRMQKMKYLSLIIVFNKNNEERKYSGLLSYVLKATLKFYVK